MPTIAEKVQELWETQQEIVRLNAALELAKAKVEQLEFHELPDLFLAARQREATLENGCKAIRTIDAKGSLPSADEDYARHEQVAEWMTANGMGDNLQAKVEASWGQGERAKAVALAESLRGDNSVSLKLKNSIHWKTYCKLIKDRVVNHPELETPLELLGVQVRPRVKISVKPREE